MYGHKIIFDNGIASECRLQTARLEDLLPYFREEGIIFYDNGS